MSKILVTGGAGFIGSHLVDELIGRGHQVVVVDNISTGRISNLNGHVKFYEVSIVDPKLADVFEKEKPEFVYHLAAQISVSYSFKNVVHDGNSNIIGSLNILENCVRQGVKKIIFSSSAAVYGDTDDLPVKEDAPTRPASPYGISKLTTESYLDLFYKEHGLDYVILRNANVFGPRQTAEGEAGVITIFLSKLMRGEQPTITGDGGQTRDFVYVKDVVEANISAMRDGARGVYNISSNTETRIKDLFYTLKELTGTDLGPKFDQESSVGIRRSVLCNERACRDLEFTVKNSLKSALEETVRHIKTQKLNEGIWLIMAAHNEEDRIGKVLKVLNSVTENIVVVDDCSTDRTYEIASQYRCHVSRHPINFGQGAALQTGMEYALSKGARVLVHFDGDGQMQIKDIDAVAGPVLRGEVDVVLGSRFLKNRDNVPFSKKYLIHKPATYLNWLLTGMKLTDAHCGFRALSADAARCCSIQQDRMAHATEILDLIKSNSLSYMEVPVDILYHEYGQSFLKGFRILRDLQISKYLK